MIGSAKPLKTHQPCPCGKSSDAFSTYDDGHGYCFSGICSKPFFKTLDSKGIDTPEDSGHNISMEDQTNVSYQYTDIRGISADVCRRYGIRTKFKDDKPLSVGFPYQNDSFIKARSLESKTFWINGNRTDGVFGKEAFPKGSFDTIAITEGEFDAASVHQMVGFASVSVQSSSQALKDCKADFDYINSAKRIYLVLDADEPGHKATKAIASLFPFDKVFVVTLDSKLKDANGYLQAGKLPEFRKAVSNAKKYVPDGVMSTYQEIFEVLKGVGTKPVCTVPFKELQEKMEGFRLGTSVLISGLEGIGKTEIVRKFEHHILKNTEFNIGIIHLEESQEACIKNLLSYELQVPLKRQATEIPPDELLKHYQALTKRDNRAYVYSHFGSSDPDDFLQIVRFLVQVCECKFIFFDHINILVSGLAMGNDERRTLDYLCSRLAMLVEELDFCLVFVCHENNEGGTRGSMNMSQTAHVRIRLSRDKEHPNPVERNRLHLSLAKNRPVGPTGPCGYAWYNEDTGVLEDGFQKQDDILIPLEE